MKKLIYSIALLAVFLTLAASCQKDDGNGTTPAEDTSDLLKLSDNGVRYSTWNLLKRHENGFIGAGAPNSFTSAYGIAMPETIAPGTYELSPTSLVQVTKTENSGSTTYIAQSGTMTITKHDMAAHYIAGTFSGVIAVPGSSPVQSRTITDGEFRVNY
jgi:hypothetical protein